MLFCSLAEIELFFKQIEGLIDPSGNIKSFQDILQFFSGSCCQGHSKIGQLAGFSEIGMAQKDLQLFFEERIEFQQLFDRGDDADGIGLNSSVMTWSVFDNSDFAFSICFQNRSVRELGSAFPCLG